MPGISGRSGTAALACSITLVLLLAACERSGPVVPVEPGITASESSIFLAVGERRDLTVTVSPANSGFGATTEDPAVATVTHNAAGVTITGVGEGFGSVTLTLLNHVGIHFRITVEVSVP